MLAKDEQPYWGLYRAIVADNDDPRQLGRLRLRVPQVSGNDIVTDWAFPRTGLWGNANQGAFAVPNVGDVVWCEFESGDPCLPIWSGSWWGYPGGVSDVPNLAKGGEVGEGEVSAKGGPKGSDTMVTAPGISLQEPESPYAAEYPSNRVIVTKSGIVIELDETEGAERIAIWHPSQSYTEFHPDGKRVERVKSQRWLTIEGSNRVHVHGDSDVVVDGNASLRVNGDYDLNVGGDFTMLVGGSGAGNMQTIVNGEVLTVVSGFVGTMIAGDCEVVVDQTLTLIGHPAHLISA